MGCNPTIPRLHRYSEEERAVLFREQQILDCMMPLDLVARTRMLADKRVLVIANMKGKESGMSSALLSKDSATLESSRGDVTASGQPKKTLSRQKPGVRKNGGSGGGADVGTNAGVGAGQLYVTVVGASMEVPTTQGMSCCIWLDDDEQTGDQHFTKFVGATDAQYELGEEPSSPTIVSPKKGEGDDGTNPSSPKANDAGLPNYGVGAGGGGPRRASNTPPRGAIPRRNSLRSSANNKGSNSIRFVWFETMVLEVDDYRTNESSGAVLFAQVCTYKLLSHCACKIKRLRG